MKAAYSLVVVPLLHYWRQYKGSQEQLTLKMRLKLYAFWFLLSFLALSMFSNIARPSRAKLPAPDFKAEIIECSTGYSGNATNLNEGFTGVHFLVELVNRGSASIVWRWKCKATLSPNQSVESKAERRPLYSKLIPMDPTKNQPTELTAENYLPIVLLQSALPSYRARLGWVVFKFKRNLYDELQRPGVVFNLSFEDAAGAEVVVTFTNSTSRVAL